MDQPAFQQLFPEVVETYPQLVAAKLAAAAIQMGGPDASVWGNSSPPGTPVAALTTADLAQGYLAAHLVMTSPFGTQLAQAADDKPTGYLIEFQKLALSVGGGFLVSGAAGIPPGPPFPCGGPFFTI